MKKASRVVSVDLDNYTADKLQDVVNRGGEATEWFSLAFKESWHVNVQMNINLRWGERRISKGETFQMFHFDVQVNWSSFNGHPAEAAAFLSLANEVTTLASRLQAYIASEIGEVGHTVEA